jgi:hypothetical protein
LATPLKSRTTNNGDLNGCRNKKSGRNFMELLTIDQPIEQGAKGKTVRAVQEWLGLQGIHTAIDGGYGPATATAVGMFQSQNRLRSTGVVDKATFERLAAPMAAALEPIMAAADDTLGAVVIAYAQQHLAQHPREIGGQNRGPWVRLYMAGNEGAEWPWCAGFATFTLKQACDTVGCAMPIGSTVSCDLLAASAQENDCFVRGAVTRDRSRVKPGSLFLSRRTAGDWVHTGIVVRLEEDVFHTIEGNTNDSGDREGYEVCARVRGYKDKDFVTV